MEEGLCKQLLYQFDIKILVRRHYRLKVVFFGGTRQCAFYNGSLYNKQGTRRKSLDLRQMSQWLLLNGAHSVDMLYALHGYFCSCFSPTVIKLI